MIDRIRKYTLRFAAIAFAASAVASSAHGQPGADEPRFIEGFPDIPYLAVVEYIIDEPVIFDTASGTVAEVELKINKGAGEAFMAYGSALKELGWLCRQGPTRLACSRGDSVVSISLSETDTNGQTLILRLEPRH